MVLASLSRDGLQKLMNICSEYGSMFRYTYNASKSAVVVANDMSRVSSTNNWTLGNDSVVETDSYTHLGTLFNKHNDMTPVIIESRHKLRKIFFTIVNCG